jgi:hypothetical protein
MAQIRKSVQVVVTIVMVLAVILTAATQMSGAITIEAPWGCSSETPTIEVTPGSPFGNALAWECPGCPPGG